MKPDKQRTIYLCSDSTGETAEAVVRATLRQFDTQEIPVKRVSQIKCEADISRTVAEAAHTNGLVVFTLVQPQFRELMKSEAIRLGVRVVDIMGPMIKGVMNTFNEAPKREPGLLHELDEDYFRRVEAVEFAVKCDDGRNSRGLLQANVVLIGISRTSKTPLSIFLAHKGFKVANLPLIPEVEPPTQLFQLPSKRIVGLTMDAHQMLKIRNERLKVVGLPYGAQYATFERIVKELDYADALLEKIGCTVLDVTDKAIEETAADIMGNL